MLSNHIFISYDKNNPQLKALRQRLKNLLNGFPSRALFQHLNLEPRQGIKKLKILIDDLDFQCYKFYNAPPGKLIPLYSSIQFGWSITIYAVRNAIGEFSILLKRGNSRYFELDKLPAVHYWLPTAALNDYLQHLFSTFQKNCPLHLKPYGAEHFASYADAVKAHSKEIDALKEKECITIPADREKNRAYPLKVVKLNSAEFIVLLQTDNKAEPFIQINTEEKKVYKEFEGFLLPEQAIVFLQKLAIAKAAVQLSGVPTALCPFIQKNDLLAIYQSLLDDKVVKTALLKGEPFRVENKSNRTVNVTRDIKGDFILFLETKSKKENGDKDPSIAIVVPNTIDYATIKPSWRIDLLEPQEWVNKCMMGARALDGEFEGIFSQHLQKKDAPANALSLLPNISLLSTFYVSQGLLKQSQYSRRAFNNLYNLLKNTSLTLAEKDQIAKDILDQIAFVHSQNKVHQDIKCENILIYKDENGYRAKITDFGNAHDFATPQVEEALATAWNASPEILIAYQSKNHRNYSYYLPDEDMKTLCYGYIKLQQQTSPLDAESDLAKHYRIPHPSNDMWATGVVLHQLYYSLIPISDESVGRASPLIKGLLEVDRSKRLTAQQACQFELESAIISRLNQLSLIKST